MGKSRKKKKKKMDFLVNHNLNNPYQSRFIKKYVVFWKKLISG